MRVSHAVFILGAINGAAVRRALAAWKRGHSLVLLNEAAALWKSGEFELALTRFTQVGR